VSGLVSGLTINTAQRLEMGSWTYVSNLLREQPPGPTGATPFVGEWDIEAGILAGCPLCRPAGGQEGRIARDPTCIILAGRTPL
jgi:hypothetical protein